MSPEEVINIYHNIPNVCIIIEALHLVDIKNQLLSLGVAECSIDIQGFGLSKDYYTFKDKTPYEIIYANIEKYDEVFNELSDERSKEIFVGLLNSKISLDNIYMKGLNSNAEYQYFDKEIVTLNEEDTICDCGSYNGDTLERYIWLEGSCNYRNFIAIEADKTIYQELVNKVALKNYSKVTAYNLACWNEKHF